MKPLSQPQPGFDLANVSPTVSVVIPVFNDAARLGYCLAALETQTFPGDKYEVIVVDNNSTDNVKQLVGNFSHAVYVHESRPGSYAARNAGIKCAKGVVVAFTDSDCIPATDWIERGVVRLQQTPNCGLVAGKVNIFFKDPERPTAVELYERINAFRQHDYVRAQRFGATANVFTLRAVLDHVGPFNSDLKSSGDREWGQRVAGAGYSLVYADDVQVSHPARRSLKEFYKKYVRILSGHYDLRIKNTSSFGDFIIGLAKDLARPCIAVPKAFLDPRLRGIEQKCKVALVIVCLGCVRAWGRIQMQFARPSDIR
jgi:glycosyltransferase involved in cell wall biosynthesis